MNSKKDELKVFDVKNWGGLFFFIVKNDYIKELENFKYIKYGQDSIAKKVNKVNEM